MEPLKLISLIKKKQKKIILLFGPTASGKSKLALDIAKKFNAEIVNADSMQVYKEIKILSARPDDHTISHHLYGFISIKKTFSTGEWIKKAIKTIKKINKKGKIALVVGGTGLYFKALYQGFSEIPKVPKPKKDFKLKKNYILKYPNIFKYVSLNDKQRLQRAFLVFKHTGKPLWMWQQKNKRFFKSSQFHKFYLCPPKPVLESRIKKRFLSMLKKGAIREVENFKKINPNSLNSSNFIIGLKEISQFLNNEISLEELKQLVLIRSRQYSKRQFTWQRGQMKDWKGFSDTNYLDLRKKVIRYLSKT